jgi:nitrate reductase beta subunit
VGAQKLKAGEYFTGGETMPQHKTWFFYLARICNHCSYPACLAACPRNAIYKRPEDGIVLIDQERCRGYRKCMEACPYKKTFYRGTTRTSEKCIGCFPRVEGKDPQYGGLPMQTRCMAACIGQIRLQGLVQLEKDGTWKEDATTRSTTSSTWPRSRCRSTRSSGRSPTATTSRPAGCPGPTSARCSAPAWMPPSSAMSRPTANCSPCCSSSARTRASATATRSRKAPRSSRPTIRGKKFELFDDTVIGFAKDGSKILEIKVEEMSATPNTPTPSEAPAARPTGPPASPVRAARFSATPGRANSQGIGGRQRNLRLRAGPRV